MRHLRLTTTAILALALFACATVGKKRTAAKNSAAEDGEPLNLTAAKAKNGKGAKAKGAAGRPGLGTLGTTVGVVGGMAQGKGEAKPTGAVARPAGQLALCRTVANKLVPALTALYQRLPQGSYIPGSSPLDQLLAATPDACTNADRREPFMQALSDAINRHSGRIGVILPLTGPNAKLATFVVAGLRAAVQDSGGSFDQLFVLKDSAGFAKNADTALAELVFKDRVAMVIGGFERAEAEALVKWSNDLMLPVLVLNRDRDLTTPSRYAFMLYPDEKRLADTLVATADKRNLHRIAVLRPSTGKSNKVSEYFKTALTAKGGTVVYDLVYTPGNFDSMQSVSRQLFKADPSARAAEWREAYTTARKQAEDEGVAFDPRMVVLKPIVDFDAVFIPDDFRTVRHFAKLFKYYMVDHLPLIGNHEWRSPALIDPYDDFLEGSMFADFIGSYGQLPTAVTAPTPNSPYFVDPQNVVAVDFQLVGYRAGKVAAQGLKNPRLSRRQIPAALMALQSDNPAFFGKGKIFDRDRHGNWPTYVFTVSKRALTLEPDMPSTAAVPRPGAPY